ncbi:MAG: hypothetical protein MZV65_17875 [Chromatiales bacterium]|nr:hypothetical protein [Chromatiales bacterium]
MVDAYGDILGLVTLEPISSRRSSATSPTVGAALARRTSSRRPTAAFLIQGGVTLRDLNRRLDWDLPVTGPKTLNGLITDHLRGSARRPGPA